jgi:large subunit ribosomal protein L35
MDRPPPTTAEKRKGLAGGRKAVRYSPKARGARRPARAPRRAFFSEPVSRGRFFRVHLLYFSNFMPKMKTHSGAKKRFKVTGTGKVRGRSAFTSHILEKKSPKRKRRHGQPAVISKADAPRVKKLLGVGK